MLYALSWKRSRKCAGPMLRPTPFQGGLGCWWLVGLLLSAITTTVAAQDARHGHGNCSATIRQAVDNPLRSPENRRRDVYRHPCATLTFFELEPDMKVVEAWPGGGWYTEILAPLLKDRGQLYAAHFDADHEREMFRRFRAQYIARLEAQPQLYDQVEVTTLHPPRHSRVAPPGSVDRVLVFRSIHNWLRTDQPEAYLAAFYQALRPGGLLGIVQHRGDPDSTVEQMARTGYVSEDKVIALAREAGFKLLGRSEINANPLDDHDHPRGVWTLPPSLRLGEQDRERYLAIGESDRMTLKFIKPARRSSARP